MEFKEWATCAPILSQIPEKGQRLGSFTVIDIKITSIAVYKNLIAAGTNMAVIYIVNRDVNEMITRIKCGNKNDSLTSLEIFESQGCVYTATGTQSGLVYVHQLDFTSPHTPEVLQQKCFRVNPGQPVRVIHFSNSMKIFFGSDNGQVIMYDLLFLYQPDYEPVILLREESPIVQISEHNDHILVSTHVHSVLYNIEEQTFTKLGTKPRKAAGPYGACFLGNSDTTPIIYAARPGLRLWRCNMDGNVQITHMFKDSISTAEQIPLISPILKQRDKSTSGYQFGRLNLVSSNDKDEQILVSESESCLLFVKISSDNNFQLIAILQECEPIVMVKCYEDEIFILRSGVCRQLIRISSQSYQPEHITQNNREPQRGLKEHGGHKENSSEDLPPIIKADDIPALETELTVKQSEDSVNTGSRLKGFDKKFQSGLLSMKEKLNAATIPSQELEQVGKKLKTGWGNFMQKVNETVSRPTPQLITTSTNSPSSTHSGFADIQPAIHNRPPISHIQSPDEDSEEEGDDLVIRLPVGPPNPQTHGNTTPTNITMHPEAHTPDDKSNFASGNIESHSEDSNPEFTTSSQYDDASSSGFFPDTVDSSAAHAQGSTTPIETHQNLSFTHSQESTTSHLSRDETTPNSTSRQSSEESQSLMTHLHTTPSDSFSDNSQSMSQLTSHSHSVEPSDQGTVEGPCVHMETENSVVHRILDDPSNKSSGASSFQGEEPTKQTVSNTEAVLDRLRQIEQSSFELDTDQYRSFLQEDTQTEAETPEPAISEEPPAVQPEVPPPVVRTGLNESEHSDSDSEELSVDGRDEPNIYSSGRPGISYDIEFSQDFHKDLTVSKPTNLISQALTNETWFRQGLEFSPLDISITNSHVWLCDKNNKVHTAKRTKFSLVWSKLNIKASSISVSPKGCLAWKVDKGNAQAGSIRVPPFHTNRMKWAEAVKQVSSIAVDDHSAWFVKSKDCEVWYQTGLSKERPMKNGRQINSKLMLTIRKISTRKDVTWALTPAGKLYNYISSQDEWNLLDIAGQVEDFTLDCNGGAWLLGSDNALYYKNEISKEEPTGSSTLWEVSYLEPLNHNNRHAFRDLLNSVHNMSNTHSIIAAHDSCIIIYSSLTLSELGICNTHVTGHRWVTPELTSLPSSSIWSDIVWADDAVLYALPPTGELMQVDINTGKIFTVKLPTNMRPQVRVVNIAACQRCIFIVLSNGSILCALTDQGVQLGLEWRTVDLIQFDGVEIVSISVGESCGWCIDSKGTVYMCIGSHRRNDLLMPAWINVDAKTLFTTIRTNRRGNMVWSLDKAGNVYSRGGVNDQLPIGEKWVNVVGLRATSLSISDNLVWVVSDGKVYFRSGVSEENPAGEYWRLIPGNLQSVYASPSDHLLGLTDESRMLEHKMKIIGDVKVEENSELEDEGWQVV